MSGFDEWKAASPIKRARQLKGWRANELAFFMDVTPQTVSDWECGSSRPRPEHLTELCEITGMDADDYNDWMSQRGAANE